MLKRALAASDAPIDDKDRRRFRRVALALSGRLLDPFGGEHSFDVINVSPGGLYLRTQARAQIGGRVVIYCDGLGRLAGDIVRASPEGFAVRFDVTTLKRDRLADDITWLWNKDRLGLSEERRFPRSPGSGKVTVVLDDGRELPCDILDMSLLGVGLACTEARPFLGQKATIAGRLGRVARYTDQGFALDFSTGLIAGAPD